MNTFIKKLEDLGGIKRDAMSIVVTLSTIALTWYCELKGKPLQSEVVVFALGYVTCKTTHAIMTSSDVPTVPQNGGQYGPKI